jgi:transcriptional antiterminator NusG
MNIYALQIRTGGEELFIKLVQKALPAFTGTLSFPKKEETRKKLGKLHKCTIPIFPGYVFLTIEEDKLPVPLRRVLKKTSGFSRFLPDNQKVRPLSGNDFLIIRKLTSFGPVARKSKACFDENDRIVILDGCLKGLEGCISKVDKRKGRVTIVLDMYRDSFPITLGVEFITKS